MIPLSSPQRRGVAEEGGAKTAAAQTETGALLITRAAAEGSTGESASSAESTE